MIKKDLFIVINIPLGLKTILHFIERMSHQNDKQTSTDLVVADMEKNMAVVVRVVRFLH